MPARRAELDHTVPFHGPREGPTSAGNLAPLCAADHTAKGLGLLRLAQPSPGVLEWTTAVGQRVRVVPGRHGEVAPLVPERRPAQPSSAASGSRRSGNGPGAEPRPPF